MMYKIIYLDFDNTIVNTSKAICSLYNEDFLYYKNFKYVDWREIKSWGFTECTCTTKEYINTYFNPPRFFKIIDFMPYAEEVISLLQQKYKIKIVSMGNKPNLKLKQKWIKCNLHDDIEFIGIDFNECEDKRNIDMSDEIFVDDNVKMLQSSNAHTKICFGDNEWNNDWN